MTKDGCQVCPFCKGIESIPEPNDTIYMRPVCAIMPVGVQATFAANKNIHMECPVYEYRHIVSFVTVLGRNSVHLPFLSHFN